MTSNNLKSIFEDCFDSSNLNHISPIPSPKPSPKPSLKHTSSPIQQLEPVMNSLNPTHIIQILENDMDLVDFEHPAGETTDDQNLLNKFLILNNLYL